MNITYDYHGLKAAHSKLEATVEGYEANAKQLQTAGTELVQDNNAEGVKSTMAAFEEKQVAVVAVMRSALDNAGKALANAKELHLAQGGDE